MTITDIQMQPCKLACEALQVLAVPPTVPAVALVAAQSLEPAAAAGPLALHDLPHHSALNNQLVMHMNILA